jgi:hypothetical protein
VERSADGGRPAGIGVRRGAAFRGVADGGRRVRTNVTVEGSTMIGYQFSIQTAERQASSASPRGTPPLLSGLAGAASGTSIA